MGLAGGYVAPIARQASHLRRDAATLQPGILVILIGIR